MGYGKKDDDTVMRRVKMALLSMQRYSWEQGVAAQAMLESGDSETAFLLARDAVIRQDASGKLGVMNDGYSVTDSAANGEAVLRFATTTEDPLFVQGAANMLDWLLHQAPRSDDGALYHVVNKPEIWVDSFYMAPPFLAIAGYCDQAVLQIEGYRKRLWNPKAKLFSHIWDEGAQVFVRQAHWGVGNGWAAAGMVRVLAALPDSMQEDKSTISGYVKETIDGCLVHIREDGLFHDVVDDKDTFVETNAAQMLSYSIYRAVDLGVLDGNYLEYAERMRQAAQEKVDDHGLVQGVCAAPLFDRSGTAPEGQAFYLLMESAARGRVRT
ncbi:glycoside hydrolase family 88 protein [Cohnella silvisoli]|uniref:Glycoside hydrolase family 88 protein n=1 Tax=Cohnella silvisoli TaxID=2873699 RepID=A0ABV1KS65_9BACL|nr:glycoside hydrolase family 88 protein [Cohnella silvisoli]MCD9021693.1 glycoside hydrolase family 88 protein [Cohnella silvisoli]